MVRMCLTDFTGYEWAVMFDAESLFGMTADELHELGERDGEELIRQVKNVQFQERSWTLTGKIESYQGENRMKLMVHRCEEINWEESLANMWKEVIRMETELETSHEEEWGIDLTSVIE